MLFYNEKFIMNVKNNALKEKEGKSRGDFLRYANFFATPMAKPKRRLLNPTGDTRWTSLSRIISCPRTKKRATRKEEGPGRWP